MLILRNVLLAVLMLVTLAITVPILAVSGLFSRHLAYQIGACWGHISIFFMRVVGGIDYRVTGLENLPEQPSIVCVKHQSMLEMFFILAVFGKQSWVLKKELLNVPLFGWCLRVINPIAINRKSGKRAIEQMEAQGAEKLRDGYHIVIYPEGTRVPPTQKKPYKAGAVLLAQALSQPLIPVAHNAGLFWHRKRFIIYTGTIDIQVGAPISVANRSVDDALTELQDIIETNTDKLVQNSVVFPNYQQTFLNKPQK